MAMLNNPNYNVKTIKNNIKHYINIKYNNLIKKYLEEVHSIKQYNQEILKYNTANIKTKMKRALTGFAGGVGISSICLPLAYIFYKPVGSKVAGYDLKANGFSPTAYKLGMITYITAVTIAALTTNPYQNIAKAAIAYNLLTSSVILNGKYKIAQKVKNAVKNIAENTKKNINELFQLQFPKL